MILNDFRICYKSRSDRFHIYLFGDTHLGNKACDVEKLKQHVKEVADNPNSYWLGLGDYCECINYTDKRFDQSQVAEPYSLNLSNSANAQFEDLLTILNPIKNKCIGLHRGNHEESLRLKYHNDLMSKFQIHWPGVKMLEDTAFTRLSFKRGIANDSHIDTFILWSAHGNAGGRSAGGKIKRVEDAMAFFDADMYVLAHGHRKIITSLTALSMNNKGEPHLQARRRIGGMTGAYFKTYIEGASTYGEKGLFSPSDLGAIKITIDPADRNYFMSEI